MSAVFKFGGTSVGIPEKAAKCAEICLEGRPRAVIVSALSAGSKATGTTNALLHIAELITLGRDMMEPLRSIKEYHLEQCRVLGVDIAVVEPILYELTRFTDALRVIGEVSLRSKDILVSFGERLSAMIFQSLLVTKYLVDCRFLDISECLPRMRDKMHLSDDELLDVVIESIARLSNTSTMYVVTGFFGAVPGDGLLGRIGRGYSDLTAALVAAASGCSELVIWKEVDGVFSADPRILKNARLLPSIRPEEANELTYYGSEVVHQATMWQASRASVSIRVKSIHNTSGHGTLIKDSQLPPQPGPLAVTVLPNITVITVGGGRSSPSSRFFARVSALFDEAGCPVHLIATSRVDISVAVSGDALDTSFVSDRTGCKVILQDALHAMGATVSVRRGCAIVALIGSGMRHRVGISGAMFGALGQADVNIEMIAQGASEVAISCVVDGEKAAVAVQAIHAHLLE